MLDPRTPKPPSARFTLVRLCLALALVLAGAAVARAEDVVAYEVEGQADAAGADARTAALDDAFAHATERALAELVPAEARKAHRADLDREIVARARLWVAKFSVGKDGTDDGRRELAVSVRIDRDKLRTRLAELGINDADAPPVPAGTPPPSGARARSVAVLLRVARPGGVVADFGPDAVADAPGVAALTGALRAAGMTVKRAPAGGAPPRPAGDLPLDDDEADALAGSAKAELALVAGVIVSPPTQVRGVAGPAALVIAHVRLVQRGDHRVIGEGAASVALQGDDEAHAIDRALAAAVADVVPPPAHEAHVAAAFHGDDTPIAEAGVVLVRMSPRTPYALVVAEQKYLTGAKGVRAATLRRLSPGGWVLGVATSESVERVAQLAKKAPSSDTQVTVKVVGEVVELDLSGTP